MKKKPLLFFIFLWMSLLLSSAYAQDYYVSALTGSDANNGLTSTTALATIQKGADLVNPGGTVFIMNGRYNRTVYGPVLDFTRPGTPDGYITFKPYPGHSPVISASGGSWDAVIIDASYVILEGLEFEGNNPNLTLAGAQESYLKSYGTPIIYDANYNTNGISMGKYATPHHIIMRNCKVHDFPGGGIGVGPCDYVTIEGNRVFNNSWFAMYATSGISVLGPKPIDAVTSYKIIIRGNTVYNNFTQVKWRRGDATTDVLSDGNGIILDANNGTQGTSLYTGRTLVENNVSYNNGGGGIHGYSADHLDIINNTAYNNGTKVGYPEIDGQDGVDVKIYNNIMYARTGGNCNGNDASIYDHNIYYNGPFFRQGANDIEADPAFVKLALDGTADFRLRVSSPAINSGSQEVFSAKDITGLARPQGSRPERGAYEYQSGTQAQTITFAALATRKLGDPDLNPGATASSGLAVLYQSSNPSVAAIVEGKIQIRGGGTTTITASQGGNGTFAEAPEVSHPLTVTAEGYGNLIVNSTFDMNTEGWTTSVKAPSTITLSSVAQAGYAGKALKADVSNGGASNPGSFDIQLVTAAPLVAGRTYSVQFKASAAVAASIDVILQSNKSPFTTYKPFWAIQLTTIPTQYNFTYTATTTDETTLIKFMLGKCTAPVYIDNVVVAAVPVPNMNVKQGLTLLANKTGSYDFGTVNSGDAKTVSFVIENRGERSLNLTQAKKVQVTGEGFSLITDAPASIDAGGNATFEVKFTLAGSGVFTGNLSIANDDPTKNPYNFSLKATSGKTDPPQPIITSLSQALLASHQTENAIKVYPVPAINELNVSFHAKRKEKIKIYLSNLHGKVIYQKEDVAGAEGENSINISTLGSGVYLLTVTTSQFSQTKKIVVEK